MEAKTNKTTTEKATTKVEKNKLGTFCVWLFFSCIVILIIAGDWISLGFIATLLIASINVPTTPMSEEEQQKRYEQNRKLAERISLM